MIRLIICGDTFGAQLIILILIHNHFPGNFCGISLAYLTLNVTNVGMQDLCVYRAQFNLFHN